MPHAEAHRGRGRVVEKIVFGIDAQDVVAIDRFADFEIQLRRFCLHGRADASPLPGLARHRNARGDEPVRIPVIAEIRDCIDARDGAEPDRHVRIRNRNKARRTRGHRRIAPSRGGLLGASGRFWIQSGCRLLRRRGHAGRFCREGVCLRRFRRWRACGTFLLLLFERGDAGILLFDGFCIAFIVSFNSLISSPSLCEKADGIGARMARKTAANSAPRSRGNPARRFLLCAGCIILETKSRNGVSRCFALGKKTSAHRTNRRQIPAPAVLILRASAKFKNNS